MPIVLPAEGEDRMLARALGKVVPTDADLTLKLYVNNYTPVTGSTDSDFTEMSTQGYVAKTLTDSSWTVAQSGGKAEALYAEQTWTFDGTGGTTNVYGYFLVDEDDVVVWAERFSDAPYAVALNGDTLDLTPRLTNNTE